MKNQIRMMNFLLIIKEKKKENFDSCVYIRHSLFYVRFKTNINTRTLSALIIDFFSGSDVVIDSV